MSARAAMGFSAVTFLSDYGLADPYVGICHGVIHRIAPGVTVIDLTHQVPPQDVARGAAALAEAVRFTPPAVHLAVVDPGVGTARRAIALETAEGPLLVGPDNGLLWPAAEALGGLARAHAVTNERLFLHPVSATFHGRDVFAPVAASLARGSPIAEVGPPLDPGGIVRLEPSPGPRIEGRTLRARVLGADGFGNVRLDAGASHLESIGARPGGEVEVLAGGPPRRARSCRAFADVAPGELAVLVDSSGSVALAANRGSAERLLSLAAGDEVCLRVV